MVQNHTKFAKAIPWADFFLKERINLLYFSDIKFKNKFVYGRKRIGNKTTISILRKSQTSSYNHEPKPVGLLVFGDI